MLSVEKYWNLIDRIDRFRDQWREEPPMSLACAPGCDECCHHRLSLFSVEVAAIAARLRESGQRPEPRNNPPGVCPFLDNKTCSIYEARPIICRTQGYPLVFEDEDGQTVSHLCNHSRSADEVTIPARFVLNIETLNNCLSSLNFLYLAEMEEQNAIIPSRQDILHILDGEAERVRA